MSNIPGLQFCPADGEEGEGLEIPSFSGTVNVPESHRYGNCRTLQDFEKLGTILEGSFGAIYKCKDMKTNEIYALKKFDMPADMQDGIPSSILREINILSTLKHANIVSAHGTLAGKKLSSNYLLLDYYPCTLNDFIEKDIKSIYEREVVKCLMKQLFQGLEYIHEGMIIHRNINCHNIIFTEDGTLKISGFNCARFYSKGNMTPGLTELIYRAPELLFQSRLYGPAVDMWSAGCVLTRLLLKRPLFTGNSELEVLSSITDVIGTPSDNIWPGFAGMIQNTEETRRIITEGKPYSDLKTVLMGQSIACKDLVQGLLLYYPNARNSAKDCLKSSYFKEAPAECSPEHLASILKDVESPKN